MAFGDPPHTRHTAAVVPLATCCDRCRLNTPQYTLVTVRLDDAAAYSLCPACTAAVETFIEDGEGG